MPPLLQKVVGDLRTKHYPRGQIMLYKGDAPIDALILKQGTIKVYDVDKEGREKILHLMRPAGLVPFAFFSGGHVDTRWYYAALTDCDVCVIPVENLQRQMEANSELAIYMMNWFSREVHELLVRLSSLGKTNIRGKVLAALKFLAVHHASERRSGWLRVNFPVNHQLLADMTGVTRESIATIMRDFQKQGAVRNPRQTILEINLEHLRAG